jgi:signal transduction histidine kinase
VTVITTTEDIPLPHVRVAAVVGFVWALVNVALLGVVLWFFAILSSEGIGSETWPSLGAAVVAAGIGSAVGATIVARFPRNPVGWLVLGALSLYVLSGLFMYYARVALLTDRDWPGAAFAGALDVALWVLVFGTIAAMLLLFPDGRPPAGARWRTITRALPALFAVTFGLVLVSHGTLDPPLDATTDPLYISAFDTPAADLVKLVLLFCCFALLVAALVSVFVRYRSAEPAQRFQLKWLLVAATTLPLTLLACLTLALFDPGIGEAAGSYGFAVLLLVIPVTIALAISKYKLYSVDRFVDSALVHLALTALLVGVYGAIVLGSSSIAGDGGRRSPVAVAVATLLVAAVVAPLRRRLQVGVNRRFHRRRFDAVHVVEDYVRRLRDDKASLSELETTMARALSDPTLELGLWQAESGSYTRMDGTALPAVDPSRSLFHVRRGDAHVAVLVHDPSLDVEPLLLDSITRAASLPIDNARLQAEVLARLEEVRASRQRIVTATYEERRRIERDLHDGAQQRLVSLALSLRRARDQVGQQSAEMLDRVAEELSDAVRELRELARGIHPASLTEEGLAAAIESLADRTPLQVIVDVPDDAMSDDVAAAAYFTACEAITNAVKHGQAAHLAIRGEIRDGVFYLEVSDDGIGGASTSTGGGLQGLVDRLEALGGRLDVNSAPGAGTVLRAELPCVQ